MSTWPQWANDHDIAYLQAEAFPVNMIIMSVGGRRHQVELDSIFFLALYELKDTTWLPLFCQKRFHWLTLRVPGYITENWVT